MGVKFNIDETKIPSALADWVDHRFAEYDLQVLNEEPKHVPFYAVMNSASDVVCVVYGYSIFDEVCIECFVVEEKYRNQGFGRQGLFEVEDYFRKKGFRYIELTSREYLGHGFYEKCGFELEFIRRHRTDSRYDKYFFAKSL